MFKRKKITFNDDITFVFWLPPSSNHTHVGVTWGKSGAAIYINGILQDEKLLREMGEWKGSLGVIKPTTESELSDE